MLHLLRPPEAIKALCGQDGPVTWQLERVDCPDCLEAGYQWTKASAADNPDRRCLEGEPVFYYGGDRARDPGHIYSAAGAREFRISGYCEFHFDLITAEPDA